MQIFINSENNTGAMEKQTETLTDKRTKNFGDSVIRLIGDNDIVNALKPWYATEILKKILDYDQKRHDPTPSMIAKDLNISPSTVTRNVIRFNDNYLVTTTKHGKGHIIKLTDKGKRYARIVENSESIEKMEEDRKNTLSLITANRNLTGDLKAVVRVREMKLRDLKKHKQSINKEIDNFSRGNSIESKLKVKELQQDFIFVDQEIFDLNDDIKDKNKFIKKLDEETRSLKHKLDEFLINGIG